MKLKKKTTFLLLGVLIVVLIGAIYCGIKYLPGMKVGKEISNLFQPLLKAENQSMHVNVAINSKGEKFTIESDLYAVTVEDTKYYVFDRGDYPIYIVDDVLYFENGKAYKIADMNEEVKLSSSNLFLQLVAVYDLVEFDRVQNETRVDYIASVTGEKVTEILSSIGISNYKEVGKIDLLQIKISSKDDVLQGIEIVGRTETGNEDFAEAKISLSDFAILSSDEYKIPDTVTEAVKIVDKDTLFSLTEDLYPLIFALENWSTKTTHEGSVDLYASCGIVKFKNTYRISELENVITNASEVEEMPSLIGFLCLEGDISYKVLEDKHIYELELKEDAMKKLAVTIAPEIVNQVIDFTNGKTIIIVENEQIISVKVDINGEINLLITRVEAEVGAEFLFN